MALSVIGGQPILRDLAQPKLTKTGESFNCSQMILQLEPSMVLLESVGTKSLSLSQARTEKCSIFPGVLPN